MAVAIINSIYNTHLYNTTVKITKRTEKR